jgi:trans-aconitate methyltransferase
MRADPSAPGTPGDPASGAPAPDDSVTDVTDDPDARYERAFATFLAHTDQKQQARAHLDRVVAGLPHRRVLLDVGAGDGGTTAHLSGRFARTVAIEPNPRLRARLAGRLPGALVIGRTILDARPPERADLVLCAHVLYHVPAEQWPAHLHRLASWTAPDGTCLVVLQNPETDARRMLRHFGGETPDLIGVLEGRPADSETRVDIVSVDGVEAYVRTPDAGTAVEVASFMLGHLPAPPAPETIEEYVRAHFATADGGYAFSCTQDFVRIALPRTGRENPS